jgi:subtilase family serine protease
LAPDDVATIYNLTPLYNAGTDGTGQKLVVVGQSDVSLSDIEQFRRKFQLRANDPEVVLVPGSDNPPGTRVTNSRPRRAAK